ncbi:MAG TPA: YciI family protein, partial [Devosia sp.]|nr:YciI family protein [Devosia sp.]
FLDEAGNANGSLLVVEAASLEDGKALAAADPFVTEGVFASYEVKRWNWGINNPDKRGQ